MEFFKYAEKLTFWASNDRMVHIAKNELLDQINHLTISISGKGFFTIDRQFLARVWAMRIGHFCFARFFDCSIDKVRVFLLFQMMATCSTYVIIFVQFYLTNNILMDWESESNLFYRRFLLAQAKTTGRNAKVKSIGNGMTMVQHWTTVSVTLSLDELTTTRLPLRIVRTLIDQTDDESPTFSIIFINC